MTITDQILAKIKQYETIIIHRHQRPDPDAIGSQGGLAEIIKTSFPEKKVLMAGSQPEGLEYLETMDEVLEKDYANALVIVVDTANTPRIDGKNYEKGQELIKIDHHPNDEPYGDICYVDTTASSCAEIVADFYFTHEDELSLSDNGARLLYAGIVGDTGRFLYPATTGKTFALVSKLREFHFDAALLNRQIDQVSEKVAKLFGYVFENLQVDEFGAGSLLLSEEIMNKYQVSDAETSAIVSLPGKIESVLSWCIFVYQEDGTYRVRLRSKGPVINGLAKHHHGGGHPLASGAKAKDLKEAQEIYQELQKIVREFKKV